MVKKVQEENSNFQNGNLFIENIDTKRASEDCLKVVLSDGSFFWIRYKFYIENRLGLDLKVDEELLSQLELESDFFLCSKKAYDLLALRDHSKKELEIKLLQRSFDKEIISLVLNKLEENKFLDDERFAKKRVKSLISRKGVSKNFIKADLYKKGINREIADKIINSIYTKEVEIEQAKKVFEKLKNKENIYNKMLSRGFNYRIINDIINGEGGGSE